ncbi:MAG: DUF1624 domain-containing protein [Candidatus Aureabacteria bacterium]|nr:DUF1624 domain-containing protein [Candidatus Auribacterota bacterium]
MEKRERLEFFDTVRGVVMLLMALDHASFFWNAERVAGEGLHGFFPRYANIFQMFTRVASHFTPTAFLFIAGCMMAVSAVRRETKGETRKSVSWHFTRRGLWLLFLQFTFVNFGFMTKPYLHGSLKAVFFLDVLWAIGVNLILLSWLRCAGRFALAVLAAVSLFLLPLIPESGLLYADNVFLEALGIMFFSPSASFASPLYCLYPVFPWTGVMVCGYLFGRWLMRDDEKKDEKLLRFSFFSGAVCLAAFFFLRTVNSLGNRIFWSDWTVLEFFAVSKYPPSLVYFLLTAGLTLWLLFLSFQVEKSEGAFKKISKIIQVFGRVPLFFYVLHLYLYGVVPLLLGLKKPVSLISVYGIWLAGIFLLIKPCQWFYRYKVMRNQHKSI